MELVHSKDTPEKDGMIATQLLGCLLGSNDSKRLVGTRITLQIDQSKLSKLYSVLTDRLHGLDLTIRIQSMINTKDLVIFVAASPDIPKIIFLDIAKIFRKGLKDARIISRPIMCKIPSTRAS